MTVSGRSVKLYQNYLKSVDRRNERMTQIKRRIFYINAFCLVLMTVPMLIYAISTR